MKNYLSLAALLLLIWVFPNTSFAQIDATGFIRNYNAVQTRPDNDILIGRNHLRLNLGRDFSKGTVFISNDVQNLYSASADSIDYRLREAYVDLYFPKSDLRMGKQMITWGRANGAFIADIITPNDLTEFLTQDFADLRRGITALNFTRYFGSNYIQLILNPIFVPNKLPAYESRWFPNLPVPSSFPVNINKKTPENTLHNMQGAARFALRSNLHYDLDMALFYWRNPNPRYYKELQLRLPEGPSLQLTEQYTQSLIGSYSGSVDLTDKLLLISESAFYRQRSFDYLPDAVRSLNLENPAIGSLLQAAQAFSRNDDGFLTQKPWLISMIGLQYPYYDVTISVQFTNEHIFDYNEKMLQKRDFYYATLQLQRSFFRNKFQLNAFSRYNFLGADFWVNPELTYTGIDSFEATVGAQLFGGREPGDYYGHVSFKNFASSSFAYLQISAYF